MNDPWDSRSDFQMTIVDPAPPCSVESESVPAFAPTRSGPLGRSEYRAEETREPLGEGTADRVWSFYQGDGWDVDSSGATLDAKLWEDLRPCAEEYVKACRLRLRRYFPESGEHFLDAASGPVQYREYLEYSRGFQKRVCVDLSPKALMGARAKLEGRGEYVCCDLLHLPFPDDHFDAIASLHTIYHIPQDDQERAVRQLIRVARPGSPIVIVYANPNRLLARLKRWFKWRGGNVDSVLYFHPHPLGWWSRFADQCEVAIDPWRSLKAEDSKRLIPDNAMGRYALKLVFALESRLPSLASALGAYPVIRLRKRGSNQDA